MRLQYEYLQLCCLKLCTNLSWKVLRLNMSRVGCRDYACQLGGQHADKPVNQYGACKWHPQRIFQRVKQTGHFFSGKLFIAAVSYIKHKHSTKFEDSRCPRGSYPLPAQRSPVLAAAGQLLQQTFGNSGSSILIRY